MIRSPGTPARSARNTPWLLLLALPVMALAAALALTRRVVVRGWSMAPGLLPGEELLCEGVTYRLRQPRRGDIVLAQGTHGAPALLVKRIAAAPGDLVALADRHCWVNGVYCGENSSAQQTHRLAAGSAGCRRISPPGRCPGHQHGQPQLRSVPAESNQGEGLAGIPAPVGNQAAVWTA